MQIGAQFFTVREFTKDLEGLALSLKRVADIGYRTVQISGTCAFAVQLTAEAPQKTRDLCSLITALSPITRPLKLAEVSITVRAAICSL